MNPSFEQAEGVEEEFTMNEFICLDESEPSPMSTTAMTRVPDDYYPGSSRVLINVVGKLNNLHDYIISSIYSHP